MKKIFLGLAFLNFAYGQFSITDSASYQNKKTCKYSVIKNYAVPTILICYGVSVIGQHKLITSSYAVRDWRNKNYANFNSHADDIIWAVPAFAPMVMSLCGVETKHNVKIQFFRYALATILSNVIIQPLKYSTKIMRPDSTTANSFPSGHTTISFVGAEIMNQELGFKNPLYSVGGYAIASVVGTMRVLNNRHWFADVLVGAGVGILSTKLVYVVCNKLEKKKAARIRKALSVEE